MSRENDSVTEPFLGDNGSSSKPSGNSNNLYTEEDIKAKLQWYYKNPYEKYKDRGRKPYKLILQVIKIVLVTLQATLFSVDEFSVVQFNMDNIETFRNLFLVDYAGESLQELYRKQQVYTHMFYAWEQYYNFDHIMIGSYELQSGNASYNYAPIQLCTSASYLQVSRNITWKGNVSSYNDASQESGCRYLKPPPYNQNANKTTLEEFIIINNLTHNFEWILYFKLKFSFIMNNTTRHQSNSPDCYTFDIEIVFDNSDLDGIMTVRLDSSVDFHICRKKPGKLHIREYIRQKALWTTLDMTIIVICIVSFALCVRSFKRHFKLALDASKFFRDYRHEKFTLSDKMNFLSFWLVLIVLSDICSVAGSLIKILLDWLELPEIYNACSLCFGLAVLFCWIGVLRYLGFMKGYNTLLVTLKTAFPTIIRFSFCVMFIYFGFAVCGWIVFGPYHTKFRNLFVTSECLFSLINGDDMFATFSEMDDSDALVWYFSKIYLYIFISLFIFVVLSLFIGIMADTYERIRDYGHPPKSRLELFMEGNEYLIDEQQQHRHSTGDVCHRHHKIYGDSDTDSFDDTSCQHDLSD